MKNLWSRWVAFCGREEPATGLALFRIGVGLVVLYTLGSVWAADLIDMAWTDVSYGGYRPLHSGNWVISAIGTVTPTAIYTLFTVSVISALALVVGLGGRVTAFVCLQAFMACTDANSHAGGSYDELLHNALWLLVLGPPTATLSADCWLRTGSWRDDTPRPGIVRLLAIYQLLLMYWTTGLQKLSTYWVPGGDFSALYYILQQPSWQRTDMSWVAAVFPLTQVGTAVTWLWEVGAPIWLVAIWFELTRDRGGRVRAWFNRFRISWIFVILGVTFHLGVTVVMNIGPFSWASLVYYACLVHPEGWRRLERWLRARWGTATSPSPG